MNAKGSKESSKENSGINKKNQKTIPTIQEKQEDDLTYSVSVLEAPPMLPKSSPKDTLSRQAKPEPQGQPKVKS